MIRRCRSAAYSKRAYIVREVALRPSKDHIPSRPRPTASGSASYVLSLAPDMVGRHPRHMYDTLSLMPRCVQLLYADLFAAPYVDTEAVVRFARGFCDQVRLRLRISRAIFY